METSLIHDDGGGVLRADDGCECCSYLTCGGYRGECASCGKSPYCCCNKLCGIRVWLVLFFIWLVVLTVLAILPFITVFRIK